MRIETDYKAVVMSWFWSWMLWFIPTLVIWLAVKNTVYALDGNVLVNTTGVFTKQTKLIELFRVKTITATQGLFSGGVLTLEFQDGTLQTCKYVKNPSVVATGLRAIVESSKAGKDFKYRESF